VLPAVAPMGAYAVGTDNVYVALSGEPASRPSLEYYDAANGRTGELTLVSGDRYRTDGSTALIFRLNHRKSVISERRYLISDGSGQFGFSLWSIPHVRHTATIVLIQGADDSTRDYGFLTPFFASHGMNVVTYDQRGTGLSAGNWRYASIESKAEDVLAMIHAVQTDPAIDPHRIGVWAASNGGWVAPIVATRSPLSFMILKSAPAETIAENVLYEIEQSLRENQKFTPEQIASAMQFERVVFHSVESNTDWDAAGAGLIPARQQPWFAYMRIPQGMTTPPPPALLTALQAALVYDPAATLAHVTVPTLALFGALDKNVDVMDSLNRFRSAFHEAGMTDFTACVFPTTGHLLLRSQTGYEDQTEAPARYTGYPEAMIAWLGERGFAQAGFPVTRSETRCT